MSDCSFLCTLDHRRLAVGGVSDPFLWTWWLLLGVTSLPAALLSSTLHVLRVWHARPLVEDQAAPLVASASDAADSSTAAVRTHAAHLSTIERPAWPPPNGTLGLARDLLAPRASPAAAESEIASRTHATMGQATKPIWPPAPRAPAPPMSHAQDQ